MKNLFALLLLVCLTTAFVGCGEAEKPAPEKKTASNAVPGTLVKLSVPNMV